MTDNKIIAIISEFVENIAKEVEIKESKKKLTEQVAVEIGILLVKEIIERKNKK